MEKHSNAKSKCNRSSTGEGNTVGARSREHSQKRLEEPPKFYSKNYLKRYTHVEVRGGSQKQPSLPLNQAQGKRSPTTDQRTPARSAASQQQKDARTNSAVIMVSPTILTLAGDTQTLVLTNECELSTQMSNNENSINPYNCEIIGDRSRERDYRYRLVNAMSDIRSSYLRNDADSNNAKTATNEQPQSGTDGKSVSDEWARYETFKKIKKKVEEAIRHHKVFLIRGELPALKEALEQRGWVQKYESTRTRSLPYGPTTSNLESKSLSNVRLPDGSLNEQALTYALLHHAAPDFIWDCRNDFVEWDHAIADSVLLNRLAKPSLYTSKLGMAYVLQEAHWFHETNVADVLFPRSYNPSRESAALERDFRRCAALAVIRRFVDRMQNLGTFANDVGETKQHDEQVEEVTEEPISLDRIAFAVKVCEDQIAEFEHEDIDSGSNSEISEEDWQLFLKNCEKLLYTSSGIMKIAKDDPDRLKTCYAAAQSVLNQLKNIDPQFTLNGEWNIWIVKPSTLCCGSGIFITHDLKTILRKAEKRPFLVYGTKFDIRQWFLVTSTFPLTIWLFKESLLRLSSKPYTFATYHEAVHLCNTAVQERYDYERRRRRSHAIGNGEELLPAESSVRDQGWDCHKLNEYLKSAGYEGEPYYEKIYPKMSQAIVLTMLAAQDFMDRRRCSFELYGADFMVMEDLSVWLIEINTNPRMNPPSSRITQRLYSSVLDSLVKVIMDIPLNAAADTGSFELAYRQTVPDSQPYFGPCLFAFGKSMKLHEASGSDNSVALRGKKTQQQNPSLASREHNANVYSSWVGGSKQYRAWTAPPTIERAAAAPESPREPKLVDFIAYLNAAQQ